MRRIAGLLILALLALPAAARAQEVAEETERNEQGELESDRTFFIEINGGRFTPNVDEQSGLSGSPYQEIFGKRGMWIFGLEVDYELFQGFGTLSAGLAADYANIWGHGIVASSGARATDPTALHTIPIRALAVYRFDLLARRWGIPLIPFGKVGLAHTIWWITNGEGDVAKFREGDGGKALGGKWGYQLAGGLALQLNFLDPLLGGEFDREFGVNSVTLHAQFARITADNFGGDGLDLTANTWLFGLGFEF